MDGYVKWSDVRAEHVARAGGEEAVAAGKARLMAEIAAYQDVADKDSGDEQQSTPSAYPAFSTPE